VLRLEDVEASYGSVRALKGISLEVQPGEIVALIGANGAGKTTTLRTIMGLLRPRGGRILFDGRRIDGMGVEDIVASGVCLVPKGAAFSRA
jgi:branched-chain amino acid transport system ATP-binding protein